MTTKSIFVECNRNTSTANIYSNDYHRWRTTLTEPFSIKRGDQLRMSMAVLSLLGTGDYIELTGDDIEGENTIINPYANLAQMKTKYGTGLRLNFYYNNNDRGKDKWFVYGSNPPTAIAGTNPVTTFDNFDYYVFRQSTTAHLFNSIGNLHISSHFNYIDIDNDSNEYYTKWNLRPNITTGSSLFLENISGFCRNKCRFKILNTPNIYPSGGAWVFGFMNDNGGFKYCYHFFKNGNFNIVSNNITIGSGTWDTGDRFKICRRMFGVYFKQMKNNHRLNNDIDGGEQGENHTDYYTNLIYQDIRTQDKKDNNLYDNEWDEEDLRIGFKNNTTDSSFMFGDVKHIKLQEYLRTDNDNYGCKWANPKILNLRDDEGYFLHHETKERLNIDKDYPTPEKLHHKTGLGAIGDTAYYTNFLFDATNNSESGFNWIDEGFYSESDIASRVTEQLNNPHGYYPHQGGGDGGTNPTGSKGLIVNGLLWYYSEATADDNAEFIFVNHYWYKPLPPLNEMFCLFFPPKRALVGGTSPVLIYNDSVSRFELQYFHAPYKLQTGTDKGQDTAIMVCNTGLWDGNSFPINITRGFIDKFGGIGLDDFINPVFWRKIGYDTKANKYGFINSTGADINISYNASVEQYSLPDESIAQPDGETNNKGAVKFVDAKSSHLRATYLPLKVEFPYFLMLTNLPISGVGNKYYANDGGVYNCLGHIARNYSALDFIYQLDGNTFTVDCDAIINYIDIDIRLPNMTTPPNITSYSSVILEFISTIQDTSFKDITVISQQTIDTSPTKKKNRKEPEDDREDNRDDNRGDNRKTYKKK